MFFFSLANNIQFLKTYLKCNRYQIIMKLDSPIIKPNKNNITTNYVNVMST